MQIENGIEAMTRDLGEGEIIIIQEIDNTLTGLCFKDGWTRRKGSRSSTVIRLEKGNEAIRIYDPVMVREAAPEAGNDDF